MKKQLMAGLLCALLMLTAATGAHAYGFGTCNKGRVVGITVGYIFECFGGSPMLTLVCDIHGTGWPPQPGWPLPQQPINFCVHPSHDPKGMLQVALEAYKSGKSVGYTAYFGFHNSPPYWLITLSI